MKKNNGYIFWITGLSGAGKTSLAKLIKKKIEFDYGKTILLNGDDLREIFKFNTYSKNERKKLALSYSRLCLFLSKQGFNVIFTVVGLFHEIHKFNRKFLKNYLEIFIKSDVKKIISIKKKKTYKNKSNIVGIDIKAEYPIKPHIIIKNNFTKPLDIISDELYKKIKKNINE